MSLLAFYKHKNKNYKAKQRTFSQHKCFVSGLLKLHYFLFYQSRIKCTWYEESDLCIILVSFHCLLRWLLQSQTFLMCLEKVPTDWIRYILSVVLIKCQNGLTQQDLIVRLPWINSTFCITQATQQLWRQSDVQDKGVNKFQV